MPDNERWQPNRVDRFATSLLANRYPAATGWRCASGAAPELLKRRFLREPYDLIKHPRDTPRPKQGNDKPILAKRSIAAGSRYGAVSLYFLSRSAIILLARFGGRSPRRSSDGSSRSTPTRTIRHLFGRPEYRSGSAAFGPSRPRRIGGSAGGFAERRARMVRPGVVNPASGKNALYRSKIA